MDWLTLLSARLSRGVLHLACACLAALGVVVIYGVVMRYVFNASQPYVEQVALLMVISVAMFGAAAGARESGHIGLDSVVQLLPARVQAAVHATVELLILAFAVLLFWGSWHMATSTWHDTIPTLGISEAFRYLPPIVAAVLIAIFSIEHHATQLLRRDDERVAA
jgi:TRAP-type C4-dicarboxylate transport system permease small subunit